MNRNITTVSKPEFVLKRANDLIKTAYGSNADREKRLALELLHNVISGKKRGINYGWSKIHEKVMLRHVELCVDLKEHRLVKDGLHQYRNLCQNIEPVSLEIVINHLIDLSERKANDARNKADRVALAAAARVADLDQEESVESLLLSSMTDEGSKQRTDREVVVPWLKFLWEIYRAILELLHKNTKYDRLYHKVCEKAFKFCDDFKRNLEFRRLSQMLRDHLSTLQKLTNTVNKANKAIFEWTPEAVDLNLQTRLLQLEVATTLELWNEGFRIVADIYAIMTAGRKTPKPRVMATYYEKLTRIFWVSENYLFHAYAWFKFYNLKSESKKEIDPEEKALLASSVLLSALIIPSLKEVDPAIAAATNVNVDDDDMIQEKNQQMATLLDFQSSPTRQNLLADVIGKGLLKEVMPEVAKLYYALEIDFKPLSLPKSIEPIIAAIKSHPSLAIYAIPLQRFSVLKVVQQLSKVYSTLKISKLKTMMSYFPDLTFTQIEKIMIDGVARKQCYVRIDHINQCLHFGSVVAAELTVESQVAQVGSSLNKIFFKLTEALQSNDDAKNLARKEYLELCVSSAPDYYMESVQRKGRIIDFKETLEEQNKVKSHREMVLREEAEKLRLKIEKDRQEAEELAREAERKKQQQKLEECEKLLAEIERYKGASDLETLLKMDPAARIALLTKTKSEFTEARKEQQRKFADQAKRMDYIIRAQRMEESKIINELYESEVAQEKEAYDRRTEQFVEAKRAEHAAETLVKNRLSKMQAFRTNFEALVVGPQLAEYEKKYEDLRQKAIADHWRHKVDQARKKHIKEVERVKLEKELERKRIEKEASDREQAELAEKVRQARAAREELQKEREAESERIRAGDESKRADDDKSNAKKYVPPSARGAPASSAPTSAVDSDRWRSVGSADRSQSNRPQPPVPTPAASATSTSRFGFAREREAPPAAPAASSRFGFASDSRDSRRTDGEETWRSNPPKAAADPAPRRRDGGSDAPTSGGLWRSSRSQEKKDSDDKKDEGGSWRRT